MRLKLSWLAVIVTVVLLFTGCASAMHTAVVADATFAQAVFALDDAEFTACQTKVLTVEQCTLLDPKVKSALVHVKAITAALQATPKNAPLPTTIPDLLQDLSDVRAILLPLAESNTALGDLAAKAGIANNRAIALLKTFTGAN